MESPPAPGDESLQEENFEYEDNFDTSSVVNTPLDPRQLFPDNKNRGEEGLLEFDSISWSIGHAARHSYVDDLSTARPPSSAAAVSLVSTSGCNKNQDNEEPNSLSQICLKCDKLIKENAELRDELHRLRVSFHNGRLSSSREEQEEAAQRRLSQDEENVGGVVGYDEERKKNSHRIDILLPPSVASTPRNNNNVLNADEDDNNEEDEEDHDKRQQPQDETEFLRRMKRCQTS